LLLPWPQARGRSAGAPAVRRLAAPLPGSHAVDAVIVAAAQAGAALVAGLGGPTRRPHVTGLTAVPSGRARSKALAHQRTIRQAPQMIRQAPSD
jgi:hypothetical protein